MLSARCRKLVSFATKILETNILGDTKRKANYASKLRVEKELEEEHEPFGSPRDHQLNVNYEFKKNFLGKQRALKTLSAVWGR